MSLTRILCEHCKFPLAFCGCGKPQGTGANAPSEPASPSGAFSCSGLVEPLAQRYWRAPFRYDAGGAMIWDARGERALDIRGWGRLTGKGALGLDDATAAEIQDDFGESVVRILNASWPNDRDHQRALPNGEK